MEFGLTSNPLRHSHAAMAEFLKEFGWSSAGCAIVVKKLLKKAEFLKEFG